MRELILDSFAGGGAYYNENDRKAAAFRRKLRRKLGRERCQQRGSYRMIVAKARKVTPDATD